MFEGMLARRYITSQKRHSALTVCSIAIALALITMMFSLFSTVMSSLRNIAYDQGEYHARITGLNREFCITEEEYDVFAEALSDYDVTCTLEEVFPPEEGERRFYLNVIFSKYLNNYADFFLKTEGERIGFAQVSCVTNNLLMLCDMIDLRSALYMSAIVAAFYVLVLFLIMLLRLIIDTAFEISSKERERQFGVLQSIGATPKQIVRIITHEGLILSAVGIPLGVGAGLGLGYLAYRAVLSTRVADFYLSAIKAQELIRFTVNPWLLLLGVVTGAGWVFLSAYGTGKRSIKMSPVQAISQRSSTVKKVNRSSLFGMMFGWTGKLASRNNRRQAKRFIATVISLTMSIALFSAGTVIIDDLQNAVEESAEYDPYYKDFIVFHSTDDDLYYREPIDMLEKSGLFGKIYFLTEKWGRYDDGTEGDEADKPYAGIVYCNRDYYPSQFDGEPPVSYDELAESGGYILKCRPSDDGTFPDKVPIKFSDTKEISEEEYNALSEEEKEFAMIYEGTSSWYCKYKIRYSAEFDVLAALENSSSSSYILIGTLDQYENGAHELFEPEAGHRGISCTLADYGDYFKALDFMETNFNNYGEYSYSDDGGEIRKTRAMLAAVKIGSAFLSILIALIAIVNMVNILSTGILNRRGEIAAMQCVGMTENQLYKTTVIECLQYALTSGIAAAAVCELMMFLTDIILHYAGEVFRVLEILSYLDYYINYIQPLPIIGIASLCAFVIAVAASAIPLHAMRKTSLVDQIRTLE